MIWNITVILIFTTVVNPNIYYSCQSKYLLQLLIQIFTTVVNPNIYYIVGPGPLAQVSYQYIANPNF